MIIPGIMAQRIAAGVAPTLWTPLNMATVPQIYLDAQDSVVTNVSGFASAISNLGAMGSSGDFSQATAGSRPAMLGAELNGKRVLRFDGVDDVLLGASTQQKDLLRNAGKGWSFQVAKKRNSDASGAAARIVFDCRNGTTGVRFGTLLGRNVDGEQNKPTLQAVRIDGGGVVVAAVPVTSTAYAMQLFYMDYAAGLASIYVNGTLSGTAALAGTGNTSNTQSSAALSIGAFNTGILAADIDLASILVDRASITSGDIDKLFGWAAHKYGLTASLPGGHPYKTVAPTV